MSKYDYLIVGAGIFGATVAHKLTSAGYKVLVMDQRKNIGGNCYTELKNDIYIHTYGPHIFHTNKKEIWDFINQFDEFEQFQLNTIAHYKGSNYNLPFNMHTFYQIYGITDINEVKSKFGSSENYKNVEELGKIALGEKMYEYLVEGYTSKQWGMPCNQIPSTILSRLPIRYEWNNNYFNDEFQGIPKHGYTTVISNMLKNSDILLNQKFDISKHYELANNIVYTGSVDELCDYVYGILPYRSLEFIETDTEETQGVPVMNFTEKEIPYTRCIDHKMFLKSTKNLSHTIKTYEYPKDFNLESERYYPIPLNTNLDLYNKYVKYIQEKYPKIKLGGRLGNYKYINMDEAVEEALRAINELNEMTLEEQINTLYSSLDNNDMINIYAKSQYFIYLNENNIDSSKVKQEILASIYQCAKNCCLQKNGSKEFCRNAYMLALTDEAMNKIISKNVFDMFLTLEPVENIGEYLYFMAYYLNKYNKDDKIDEICDNLMQNQVYPLDVYKQNYIKPELSFLVSKHICPRLINKVLLKVRGCIPSNIQYSTFDGAIKIFLKLINQPINYKYYSF